MTEINYWLMKSEPNVYGINHLKEERETIWDGIRNYQARNFMRAMKPGDLSFFYHSNCKTPGIVGLMKVIETHLVDPTQFDKDSKYFDPKSSKASPRWDCVRLEFVKEFEFKITLDYLKGRYTEDQITLVRRGNRLSIMPVITTIALELIEK